MVSIWYTVKELSEKSSYHSYLRCAINHCEYPRISGIIFCYWHNGGLSIRKENEEIAAIKV